MGFENQLRQIVRDAVLFGDSYWELASIKPFEWQRIDPLEVEEFRLGRTAKVGGEPSTIVVTSMVLKGREIPRTSMIQFSHNVRFPGPFGSSVYEAWSKSFQSVYEAFLIFSRSRDEEAQRYLDEVDSRALVAADWMPEAVATRNLAQYSLPLRVSGNSAFAYAVQERQKELQDQLEHKLFPLILSSEWTHLGWPHLIIRGNISFTE